MERQKLLLKHLPHPLPTPLSEAKCYVEPRYGATVIGFGDCQRPVTGSWIAHAGLFFGLPCLANGDRYN
ncbi:hypothetical protein Pan258_19220 [Symmachiella dynata]|nr:hypothetical protein Pan258_19220 [Symmachiella dynata]